MLDLYMGGCPRRSKMLCSSLNAYVNIIFDWSAVIFSLELGINVYKFFSFENILHIFAN